MTTDFGTDVSCIDGLKTGRIVSGRRLVAEAIYRRLTTPRGMLRGGIDEDDYGLDVLSLIGEVGSPSLLATWPGRIKNEVLKDERISNASVSVVDKTVRGSPGRSYEIAIVAETDLGPFDLTLGMSETSVEVLGVIAR